MIFFKILYVSFKWNFWQNFLKNLDVGTGAPQQRQEIY